MDKKDIFVIIITAIIVIGIGGFLDLGNSPYEVNEDLTVEENQNIAGEAHYGFSARTLTKNNLDTCDICSSSTDYCKSRPACSGCSCYN